jgi:hypothetical protein
VQSPRTWSSLEVRRISKFETNLTQLWLVDGIDNTFSLISTWQTVQAGLPQPLASYAPGIGPVFGLTDAIFNFGMSLTTDQNGNLTASLATPVANLASQAPQQFNAQPGTMGTQFDMIYQDWGKMSALAVAFAQAQRGSPWFYDPKQVTQILDAMSPALEESLYQGLMSAVYAIGSYVPGCTPGPPPLSPACGVLWGGDDRPYSRYISARHARPVLRFSGPRTGAAVTVPYDPLMPAGLYQIIWDTNAPLGFINSGTFSLTAEWWNGDPLAGGSFMGTAPSVSQPYTATVTPKPATIGLAAIFLSIFGAVRLLRCPLGRPTGFTARAVTGT